MIKGVNHVGLSVVERDRSIRFYRDLFGMEAVGPVAFEGEQHERVLVLTGVSGRAAMLRASNRQIELLELAHVSPKEKDPRYPRATMGCRTFVLRSSTLIFECERLRATSVYSHCPPVELSDGAKGTYARDPDGNAFELLEFPKSERRLDL